MSYLETTMIDTTDFSIGPTGQFCMATAQYSGVNVIKHTWVEGGDLVLISGDVWRYFGNGYRGNEASIVIGEHELTALHYNIEQDWVYAIVRPRKRPRIVFGP